MKLDDRRTEMKIANRARWALPVQANARVRLQVTTRKRPHRARVSAREDTLQGRPGSRSLAQPAPEGRRHRQRASSLPPGPAGAAHLLLPNRRLPAPPPSSRNSVPKPRQQPERRETRALRTSAGAAGPALGERTGLTATTPPGRKRRSHRGRKPPASGLSGRRSSRWWLRAAGGNLARPRGSKPPSRPLWDTILSVVASRGPEGRRREFEGLVVVVLREG